MISSTVMLSLEEVAFAKLFQNGNIEDGQSFFAGRWFADPVGVLSEPGKGEAVWLS
jgi:hypothetical protein